MLSDGAVRFLASHGLPNNSCYSPITGHDNMSGAVLCQERMNSADRNLAITRQHTSPHHTCLEIQGLINVMTGPTPYVTPPSEVPPYTETSLLSTLSTAASRMLRQHITRGAHGTQTPGYSGTDC